MLVDPPRSSRIRLFGAVCIRHTVSVTEVEGTGRSEGALAQLPLVSMARAATEVVLAVPRAAVSTVVGLPRAVLRAALDEVFAYLGEADLTGVLLSAVDFDRVLGALDLQALVSRLDLNELLAGVDLNPLLATIDLNPLVAGLDLEAVIARIDIDAIVARVDIDAILQRTDIASVAANVVDEIDLNSIVRGASATVSTEMIADVRGGSERADDRVEVFVNRMLRRKGNDRSDEGEDSTS